MLLPVAWRQTGVDIPHNSHSQPCINGRQLRDGDRAVVASKMVTSLTATRTRPACKVGNQNMRNAGSLKMEKMRKTVRWELQRDQRHSVLGA